MHQVQHNGLYITCLPGEFATGLDIPTAQIMSAEQGDIVDSVLDCRGYGSGGYSIAFPYMAPDNNSRFFARIAKAFTLHGKGVKNADSTANELAEGVKPMKIFNISKSTDLKDVG